MRETTGEGRCKGCGSALPKREPGKSGRTREWCGDSCRKRTWERENKSVCSTCWATIWKGERCRACFNTARAESREEALTFVEWMWNEGCTVREMAEELGWVSGNVGPYLSALRKAGRIGYRYKAYEQRVAA